MFSWSKLCLTYSVNVSPNLGYALVSLCSIVIMEVNFKLVSSLFQIDYLKNIWLSSLKLLRNGSNLGKNIYMDFNYQIN